MGKDAKLTETPGYPGKILEKSESDAPVMMQTEYRSIVGKLQYYQNKIGSTITLEGDFYTYDEIPRRIEMHKLM
jgi:hypothetical protein